jgi:hypothetical protein
LKGGKNDETIEAAQQEESLDGERLTQSIRLPSDEWDRYICDQHPRIRFGDF